MMDVFMAILIVELGVGLGIGTYFLYKINKTLERINERLEVINKNLEEMCKALEECISAIGQDH